MSNQAAEPMHFAFELLTTLKEFSLVHKFIDEYMFLAEACSRGKHWPCNLAWKRVHSRPTKVAEHIDFLA